MARSLQPRIARCLGFAIVAAGGEYRRGSVSQDHLHFTRSGVNSVFRVSQEIAFCYGHRLLNYEGKCRHLHGHNGKAIIVLEGEDLDSKGMLVDFSEIKNKLHTWIDDNLDHRMILCEGDPALDLVQELNEPVFVIPDNPTAENIARIIFEQAKQMGFPVVEVSLWETARSFATYRA